MGMASPYNEGEREWRWIILMNTPLLLTNYDNIASSQPLTITIYMVNVPNCPFQVVRCDALLILLDLPHV